MSSRPPPPSLVPPQVSDLHHSHSHSEQHFTQPAAVLQNKSLATAGRPGAAFYKTQGEEEMLPGLYRTRGDISFY